MKILQEIINPNTVSLTDTQQGVLVAIRMSPTPEVAFQTTNGAQQLVAARQALRSLGLVKVAGNQVILTPNGSHAVLNYNLVDEGGELTERGTIILNAFNKHFSNNVQDQEQQNQPMANPTAPQSDSGKLQS